jgi:hypothetical protein
MHCSYRRLQLHPAAWKLPFLVAAFCFRIAFEWVGHRLCGFFRNCCTLLEARLVPICGRWVRTARVSQESKIIERMVLYRTFTFAVLQHSHFSLETISQRSSIYSD